MKRSLFALALLLTACPPGETADAGVDAPVPTPDTTVVSMPDAFGSDMGVLPDAPPDAPPASPDAPLDGGSDVGVDAGADAGAGVPPGVCGPACTPTCFRPIDCVTVCGGPVTHCGCCACAPGSMDTLGCGASE